MRYLFIFVFLLATPALAVDKIYSPNGVKGELELEYYGSTTFDHHNEKNNLQEHEAELEYGLTDRVTVKLAGILEKEPHEGAELKNMEFGGRYQFFEQGEYWLDAGLLVSYGHATHHADVDAIEAKLLLEKQTGDFLHRANIGGEQEVGSDAKGGPDRVFLWNSRYRYSANIEPGFEVQADFGKAGESQSREYYVGPAIYGRIMPGLKYEAAYYFGVSDTAATGAARILLEYESYF